VKKREMASAGATQRQARRLLPVILVLLAAFALRMIRLQERDLWYDEAFAVLYSSLSPERILRGTVTAVEGAGAADVHPVLYYFLLHGWIALTGASVMSVRYLSVILGLLTVAALWRVAVFCFGRRVGLAVGLLASGSPFHVAYSQEARMYALLGLAAVAAVWGLFQALRQGSWRWWAMYVVGAALMLYAHNLGVFHLAALHILALIHRPYRGGLRGLLLADAAVLALFAPWLVAVLPGQVGFVGRGYWLSAPGAEELVRAVMLPVLTFYEPAAPWLSGLGLFTGLLVLSILVQQSVRKRGRPVLFLILAWAPVLLLYLVSLWRPVYLERVLLPSCLFYLAGVGWLLVGSPVPDPVSALLAVLLLVSSVGSLIGHYGYEGFPRPPFADVASYLEANAGPDDAVVHTNKLTYFPLRLYAPDLPAVFLADSPGSPQDTLAYPTQEALGIFATETITEAAGGADRVWLVYFQREVEEAGAAGREHGPLLWIQERYCELSQTRFVDLNVALYQKDGG
jgi:mannosyltransferase